MSGPRYTIFAAAAVTDPRMTMTTLKVLAAIGRHSNNNGWLYVNQGRIAEEIGLSRGAVNKAIGKLNEWGYLEKRHRARPDGGNTTCDYRVVLDTPDDAEQMDAQPDETDEGCNQANTPPVTSGDDRGLSSYAITTGTALEGTYTPLTPQGDVGLFADKQSIDSPEQKPPPDDFGELWSHVWLKKGKGGAERAFAKTVRRIAYPVLLERVKAQRRLYERSETPPDKRKWLQGWLNDRRYADEDVVAEASGGSIPSDNDERQQQRIEWALQNGEWLPPWGTPPPQVQRAIDEGRVAVCGEAAE